MAADDRTSQDSVVIGDDLVEALGFEPVVSDELPDESTTGGSELVVVESSDPETDPEGDIDLLDEAAPDTDADVDAAADIVDLTDLEEPPADPTLEEGEAAEAAGDLDDPPVETMPAEVVDDRSFAESEAASVETAPESGAEEEGDFGLAETAEPIVFFNNGIDTDTTPLAPTDLGAGPDETSGPAPAADAVELTEVPPPPTAADAVELTEVPPPPTAADSVIVLPPGADPGSSESDLDAERPAEVPTTDTDGGPVGPLNGEQPSTAVVAARSLPRRRKKLRARKSRRVVRHIDPWSVLTFSVLFHLCFFAAFLLASVLVWNAALAAGTIENIENFIRELGDYETFEINSDEVFKAAVLIAGLLTLASSVLVVLLTVVFNLISDLIGGIRVTVIEEETVRIPKPARK